MLCTVTRILRSVLLHWAFCVLSHVYFVIAVKIGSGALAVASQFAVARDP